MRCRPGAVITRSPLSRQAT